MIVKDATCWMSLPCSLWSVGMIQQDMFQLPSRCRILPPCSCRIQPYIPHKQGASKEDRATAIFSIRMNFKLHISM